MDLAGRLPRLQAGLTAAGCEALLVTSLTNVRYLTGFTGSAAMVLVGPDDALLVTDGRYGEQAPEEVAAAPVRVAVRPSMAAQLEALGGAATGLGTVGLEADHVPWAVARHHERGVFPDATVVPTSGLVEALRERKDAGEVARVEAAAAIADAALAEVAPRVGEGLSERALALALDHAVRERGADDVSFETIVASGPNGARPHHRPGDRRIAEGDLVVVDFGALVDGYHSDMTRTLAVGDPGEVAARMLEVVTTAQAAGVATVAPGAATGAVDEACRGVIGEAGWADAFVHPTGHGVGLDIHEAPRVAAAVTATLAPGHVITVEPGVYLREHGGVRVEDTVVVTPEGCRLLTRAPKVPAP
jgi:Xaa-Pro aminopeptidase